MKDSGPWFPEKWETNGESPNISLAYCLERVYRLQFRKWTSQSLVASLSWGDRAKRLGRQRCSWNRGENCSERNLKIRRGSPVSLPQMYVWKMSESWVKNHLRETEGVVPDLHTGLVVVLAPTSQTWKTSWFTGYYCKLRSLLPW